MDLVLAIDDTDMPGTRGTGKLARYLAGTLEGRGLARCTGVTRHQFFVGPGVPMTSHNSCAALGLEMTASLEEIERCARGVMADDFIPGSDPGLALLTGPAPGEVVAFARRAQSGLVRRSEAEELAAGHGLRLYGLAGTRDGMIGALSGAALRWEGNDGRFVALPGIRELLGQVTVAHVVATTPIVSVIDEGTCGALTPESILDTRDWVRPRMIAGQPVVVARATTTPGVWMNADRRTHDN